MKRKSYNKKNSILDIDENFNFVEEIPENEIKEYEFDDPQEEKKRRIFVLIIVFLALSLFGGGLYFAFIKPNPQQTVNLVGGDIFVVHSSVSLGATIDSFVNYANKEKAHEYTFYIQNDNNKDINYKIYLDEKKIALKSKIDTSTLNYALIKNNKEIVTGKIADTKGILATEKIKKNNIDYYVLKLWSDFPTPKYFKYIVNIKE